MRDGKRIRLAFFSPIRRGLFNNLNRLLCDLCWPEGGGEVPRTLGTPRGLVKVQTRPHTHPAATGAKSILQFAADRRWASNLFRREAHSHSHSHSPDAFRHNATRERQIV